MTCVVKNDGLIGERKGVNMPNVNISLPAITERDRQDILFGLTENIDYIAASFIRDGESVRGIRELCRENGGEHVTIFPKIDAPWASRTSTRSSRLPTASWSPVATWASRSSPSSFRTSRKEIIAMQRSLQARYHRYADARLHAAEPAPRPRRGCRRC